MSEKLKKSARHPLFKATLAAGISGLAQSAQLIISLGIDVSHETEALLKRIEEAIRDASYDSINLDELLTEAREMGDERVTKREKNT